MRLKRENLLFLLRYTQAAVSKSRLNTAVSQYKRRGYTPWSKSRYLSISAAAVLPGLSRSVYWVEEDCARV